MFSAIEAKVWQHTESFPHTSSHSPGSRKLEILQRLKFDFGVNKHDWQRDACCIRYIRCICSFVLTHLFVGLIAVCFTELAVCRCHKSTRRYWWTVFLCFTRGIQSEFYTNWYWIWFWEHPKFQWYAFLIFLSKQTFSETFVAPLRPILQTEVIFELFISELSIQ